MKRNVGLFMKVDQETPIEVQDLGNGVECKVYVSTDATYNEVVRSGNFAMWSNLSNNEHRLVIERGYYDLVKELYTDKVNSIWVKCWDDIDKLRNKYMLKIMLPVLIGFYVLVFAAFLIIENFNPEIATNVFYISILAGVIVFYIFNKILITKKVDKLYHVAIESIRKVVGDRKFEKLLNAQAQYRAHFFDPKEEDSEVKEIEQEKEETLEIDKEETLEIEEEKEEV